jgi:hypothetical protein
MNAHARQLRAALPVWYADMVCRVTSHEFQIVGLPEGFHDPLFPDRQMAEDFLAANIDTLHAKLKRGPRPCLRCRAEFISTGPGHRLCHACRNPDADRPGT